MAYENDYYSSEEYFAIKNTALKNDALKAMVNKVEVEVEVKKNKRLPQRQTTATAKPTVLSIKQVPEKIIPFSTAESAYGYNPTEEELSNIKLQNTKDYLEETKAKEEYLKKLKEIEAWKRRKAYLDKIKYNKRLEQLEFEQAQQLLSLENLSNTKELLANAATPPGFHYMPNGELMSDAEHEAREKLPKCAPNGDLTSSAKQADERVIKSFTFDSSDISQDGETRNFIVNATNGSVFSLEIQSSIGKYYNFYNNTFQTAYASLDKKVVNGKFEFSVVFPAAGTRRYDILMLAESNTAHAAYREVLLDDGNIDLSSSTGSESLILRKELWQTANRTLTYNISAKSPNGVANLSDHASVSGQNFLKAATIGPITAFEFAVTSASTKAFQIIRQPTDLDVFVEVTRTIGSDPGVVIGEDISSSTHYNWPLDNLDGLEEGMIPIGTNITANSVIKKYEEVLTTSPDTACEQNVIVNKAEALETFQVKPTLTRNIAAKGVVAPVQTGNVTFDKQQAAALADDAIKFLAYGPEKIKRLTGWDIELRDLKVELTKPTTTTTSSSVNNVQIAIASGDGIVDDVSTVSGIGINALVGNPTVTTIASYSGTTATITVDSAQTLESGTTLTFHGGGETVTISGNITFKRRGKTYGSGYAMPGWDGKFYFDLEKFITPTAEAS